MTSSQRHCVRPLCALIALTLVVACVDSPVSAVREKGRADGGLAAGKASVDGGEAGLRREIAYLKRVAADPILQDGFHVGIAGKPNATVDDLLAILERALPDPDVRDHTIRAEATLDSSGTANQCFFFDSNGQTCLAIYSTIGRDNPPGIPRNVTFAAGTACTSGLDCEPFDNELGGTMHASLVLAADTLKHAQDFNHLTPLATGRYDVLLTSPTAQPASLLTNHWINIGGATFNFGTSATSGSI